MIAFRFSQWCPTVPHLLLHRVIGPRQKIPQSRGAKSLSGDGVGGEREEKEDKSAQTPSSVTRGGYEKKHKGEEGEEES